MKTSKLTNLELRKEGFPSEYPYYLSATFELEDEHRIEELVIPKIILPISINMGPTFFNEIGIGHVSGDVRVHLGFDVEFVVERRKVSFAGDEPVYYASRVIKEKVRDMTLSDIEKKLGCRIRLVSDGGTNNDKNH